ncbi:FmdB family zinc ribbon protein [Fodinibius sp.]|uniref:FmdB family zinc ribbon protein n=1 Tax=Fodinibius sp. TaxID=1872440 RepID=UPI002ACE081C|nr:FmdB family zinc ribbon protein [Fodinibius sp.]MDZ7659983.1 FmdB family zinc ribbon protein [Fodinibius sp.]
MPTYKYKREDGTTFEIKQSIKDDALEECPETGQKVKRVISGGGGVVYKGDGFYVTDYKNSDRKEKRAKEKAQANNTSCCASGACSSKTNTN